MDEIAGVRATEKAARRGCEAREETEEWKEREGEEERMNEPVDEKLIVSWSML
jgi:hypothetical protein